MLWIPELSLHLLYPDLLRLGSSQIGWPFFFFFPRVSLLAKEKLFLCHSKCSNFLQPRRERSREGPSQEFISTGGGMKVDEQGGHRKFWCHFIPPPETKNRCGSRKSSSREKLQVGFLMHLELLR